jgi:hypothetical protein
MLPVSVMLSPAFRTMRAAHQRVVWILAAGYDGRNNGDLELTRNVARNFGMTTERDRCGGLVEAERRGLIERASQGGLSWGGKKLPTTWALTWRAVNVIDGRRLEVARPASHAWQNYVPDTHGECDPDTHGECREGPFPTLKIDEKADSPTLTVSAPSKNLGSGHGIAERRGGHQ